MLSDGFVEVELRIFFFTKQQKIISLKLFQLQL